MTEDSKTKDREIVIMRMISAPRDRVWEAFTDPKQLEQWWGPNGFTLTTESFEMKKGGMWKFVMHGPDGRDYLNKIVFTEILKPSRISHIHGGDEGEEEFNATITLEEIDGKTKVTMTLVFPSATERDRVVQEHDAINGGKQTLGRLEDYLLKM